MVLELEELLAINFIGDIRAGTTFPMKYKTENNQIYACKFFDECSGNLHLINEFVSYKIAKLLNLPIPEANLIRVKKELLPNDPKDERNGKILSELAFGSKWIDRALPKVNPLNLEACLNKQDIPKIIFFDQLILNNDRASNDGNMLYAQKERKLYIIDHSHVFLKALVWNSTTLNDDKTTLLVPTFSKKNNHMLLNYINGHSPFDNFISEVKIKLTRESIEEIVNSIPDEWCLSDNNKQALVQFLSYRITICTDIYSAIKTNWPHWKGV